MKTQFHIEKELVRIDVSGEVGREDQSQQIFEWLKENQISSRPAVLWDARGATVQISLSIFCRYARLFRQGMKSESLKRKVAVLVNDPTAAAFFLILKTIMVKLPTEYCLFQNESDARAWLTSTVSVPGQ